MIPRLSPAELRTAVRVMAIYTEATAHILAEELAAEALAAPSTPADFTPHIARLDRSPQVAAATEGDPSRG